MEQISLRGWVAQKGLPMHAPSDFFGAPQGNEEMNKKDCVASDGGGDDDGCIIQGGHSHRLYPPPSVCVPSY